MMEPNPLKPARKVGIADHLWDAFEAMAQAMGSDRDALINQAMFMFARLNGFLESATFNSNGASASKPVTRSSARLSSIQGAKAEEAGQGIPSGKVEDGGSQFDDDPARR